MEIYKVLQQIMERKNLSIAEVARRCNLADSTVRGIITRKQKSIALEVAFKLSSGLDVSLEYLNTGLETKKSPSAEAEGDEKLQKLINLYGEASVTGQDALLAAAAGISAAFPRAAKFQIAARTSDNDKGVVVMESTQELLDAEAQQHRQAKEQHKNDDL